MNGTLKVRGHRHLLRSSSTRPVSAPTTGFARRGGPGDPVWDCRLRENGFLTIAALSGGTFRALQERAFPAVGYSSGAQSRLGYSPNGASERAYHTTTGESRSKTINGLDKKSRPFAAAPPSAPLRLPRRRRSRETVTGQYPGEGIEGWLAKELPISSSLQSRNPKRGLNICRTLYFPHLPSPVSPPASFPNPAERWASNRASSLSPTFLETELPRALSHPAPPPLRLGAR
jgi:hypothetical protein